MTWTDKNDKITMHEESPERKARKNKAVLHTVVVDLRGAPPLDLRGNPLTLEQLKEKYAK